MDQNTKNSIFTGPELNKLNDFCKDCAEEDKRIHLERQYNPNAYSQEPISEPQKNEHQESKPQHYHPPSNNDYNQYHGPQEPKEKYEYKDSVKPNVIGENDPDPFNARINFDTFDQRLKQFGGGKQ